MVTAGASVEWPRGEFRFDFGPAGRDRELARAISDLTTAGYLGSTRELLSAVQGAGHWDRRAHYTSVLAAIAVRYGVTSARQWAYDEPTNPDAALLYARMLVLEAVHAARKGAASARSMTGNAGLACRSAALLAPEDPTPWVALLRLGEAPFGMPELAPDSSGPDGLAVSGPWKLFRKIMERDEFNREAFHRLVPLCTAPTKQSAQSASTADGDAGPFDDARARALTAVWAGDRAPAGSPLKLLRLQYAAERNPFPDPAEVLRRQQYGSKEAYLRDRMPGVEARWRQGVRVSAAVLAERWFDGNGQAPYMPLSDVSQLVSYLHAVGEFRPARLALAWMLPHASTEPWRQRGDSAEVLAKVCSDCGISLYSLPR
jgi:hypothetical protein